MKKLISVFVLAVMVVSVLFAVAGCSGNSGIQQNSDNSALQAELEELKDRVEDLENKNNVFWTDKAEYAEDETMTVYFKDTAVYEIRLSFDTTSFGLAFGVASEHVINGSLYVKSLKSDIFADAVLSNSYLLCENGIALKKTSTSQTIIYKDIEKNVGAVYESSNNVADGTNYDFVICVPGTAFELARFVDVSVKK